MSLTDLLTSVPPLVVYVLVGLVVGVESLGIPVPGEIVLVGASLLTTGPTPILDPLGVATGAVIGAVIGDSIGYAVGRRYGRRLLEWLPRRFPRHVDEDTIAYARYVFHRSGVLAVFLGRFVAVLRILAGPLAGSLSMRYPVFLVANVAGALAWGAGTTYGVYLLGDVVERWMKDFSYIGLAVAVVAGIAFATVFRRHVRERVRVFAAERRATENAAGAAGD